jgi:protein-S-isoprenylcysteine O-methyltransferase Ste14
MTQRTRILAGAYGALFCVLLPLLLWLWVHSTVITIAWPLPLPPWAGFALAAAGGAWMLAAMATLWFAGGGLPMNAFPPPRFATTGPYRWQRHPIYSGFALLCFGIAVGYGSAAGCYVVAPFVAAACAVLVLGYEGPALAQRFPGVEHRPWLSLPRGDGPLLARERLAVLLTVLLPWLLLYLWIGSIGPPRDAVEAWLPGERSWPVWQWTYFVYASAYPIVGLLPFWVRSPAALVDFAQAGRFAIALHTFLYLVLPIEVPPRAFEPTSWAGELLAWEGARESNGAGALPSFHTTWALFTAVAAARSFPRWRWLAWLWAIAVAASCALTGMHALLDVVAGAATFALAHGRSAVWAVLRSGAERVANSFRTWRLGPLRLFVHAGYAGSAALLTIAVTGSWAGTGSLPAVLAVCVAAVVGAALWAQWVEGASVSLRPFGYYGSVAGAAVALAVLPAFTGCAWPVAGGLCLAAPFAQAIGRLRCLVQGCCHGRRAPAGLGIVCVQPLTRVVRLAGLGGVPVYATQLYSLLWNVACGIVLVRAAQLGQPPSAITGLYLLGNGLGRFVEEAYRGEPQTRRLLGMAEYQVYAIAAIIVGAVLTCQPSAWPEPGPAPAGLSWAALGMGVFVAFAMGVDFPESDRRFARLLK